MAENSKIEWCHHTFNPWIGCTRVGPGCDNCYAARSTPVRTMGIEWGPGQPRRMTRPSNWSAPHRWNREAERQGIRYRVFCASLADVFDNEVPVDWRSDLFDLIASTPHLDWLLLTKRIGNVIGMVSEVADRLRMGSNGGDLMAHHWRNGSPPANVWLGITVVNQAEAERDIPKLLKTPARLRWLSMEPLLGPVDLDLPRCESHDREFATDDGYCTECAADGWSGELSYDHWLDPLNDGIGWVVVGGESGTGSRPMHPDWARSLRDQCQVAGVPFLFKQWGEWLPMMGHAEGVPVASQKHQHTDGTVMGRAGKKAAGRMLDGQLWDQYPDLGVPGEVLA